MIIVIAFALAALAVGVVLANRGPNRKSAWTLVWTSLGIALAVFAVIGTLVVVGLFIVVALALNNFGSNK